MSNVTTTRVLRPIGVLLGGSGLARILSVPAPRTAALTTSDASAATRTRAGHEKFNGEGVSDFGSGHHVA